MAATMCSSSPPRAGAFGAPCGRSTPRPSRRISARTWARTTPSSWRACWASSCGRRPADRLPPQALARCRIEEVDGLAIGGETRSEVARRRGDRKGDRCRADAAVNEARGAELLHEVLGESELAITPRPETQILGA